MNRSLLRYCPAIGHRNRSASLRLNRDRSLAATLSFGAGAQPMGTESAFNIALTTR